MIETSFQFILLFSNANYRAGSE